MVYTPPGSELTRVVLMRVKLSRYLSSWKFNAIAICIAPFCMKFKQPSCEMGFYNNNTRKPFTSLHACDEVFAYTVPNAHTFSFQTVNTLDLYIDGTLTPFFIFFIF